MVLGMVFKMNYFTVLGLQPAYDIDLDDLEIRHLKASRETHPDVLVAAGEETNGHAVDESAKVNEAYAVLSDPFRRGDHLLTLLGAPTASQERAMPPEFLEEVLSLRMDIEEADSETEFENLAGLIRERIDAASADFLAVVTPLLGGATDDVQLVEARRKLNVVKYLVNLAADLKKKREE